MPLNYTTAERGARLASELREAGLKATPQRLAILDCLVDDTSHPTAQEIFERVRVAHPAMAAATVYNTLSALTRVGRMQALALGGATRFDPNTTPHDHAVCIDCGAVVDVARKRRRGPAPEALAGFVIERMERIYRGKCAACAVNDNHQDDECH